MTTKLYALVIDGCLVDYKYLTETEAAEIRQMMLDNPLERAYLAEGIDWSDDAEYKP